MMKYLYTAIIACSILLTGCYDNIDDFEPYDTDKLKQRILFIVDGLPTGMAQGVTIEINDQVFTTESGGIKYVDEMLVNRGLNRISFHREGYFPHTIVVNFNKQEGSRTIRANMTSLGQGMSFNTEEEVEFMQDDIQFIIPPQAFANEDGAQYAGDYTVHLYRIPTNAEELYKSFRGIWEGTRKSGSIVALENFGQFQFYITDGNGNKLELKDEAQIEVSFKPNSILNNNINQSVPVWSLNNESGIWEEHQIGNYNNDEYNFEINETGTWMIASALPLVNISGKVRSQSNFQLTTEYIEIENIEGTVHSVPLESDGSFSIALPQNVELLLRFKNSCGTVIGEKVIGPFPVEENIGHIRFPYEPNYQLKATTTDCFGNPTNQGYFIIDYKSESLILMQNNSSVNTRWEPCGETSFDNLRATYYDIENRSHTFLVDTSLNIDYGTVNACDQIFSNEFIFVTESAGYTINQFTISKESDNIILNGNLPEGEIAITLNNENKEVEIIADWLDIEQISESSYLIDSQTKSNIKASFKIRYVNSNGTTKSLYGRFENGNN